MDARSKSLVVAAISILFVVVIAAMTAGVLGGLGAAVFTAAVVAPGAGGAAWAASRAWSPSNVDEAAKTRRAAIGPSTAVVILSLASVVVLSLGYVTLRLDRTGLAGAMLVVIAVALGGLVWLIMARMLKQRRRRV